MPFRCAVGKIANMGDINTLSSVVSAVCAVIGVVIAIAGLARSPTEIRSETHAVISARLLYAFLLTTSGWILVVLSFLWIFDPLGPLLTDRESFQIVGVMAALPAFLILRFGASLLSKRASKRGADAP